MIFTIITGVFSILLVSILLFKGNALPLVITLEVGIFATIVTCLIRVYLLSKDKPTQEISDLLYDKCPDYYTKIFSKGKEVCSNEHVYTIDNETYMRKHYPVNVSPFPATHVNDINPADRKFDKFYLNELKQNSKLSNVYDQCNAIKGLQLPSTLTADEKTAMGDYAYVPWTYMQSKCA
jgi:hypothetical protein